MSRRPEPRFKGRPGPMLILLLRIFFTLLITTPAKAVCTASLTGSIDVNGIYTGTFSTRNDELNTGGYDYIDVTLDGSVLWSQYSFSRGPQQFALSFNTACWTAAPHVLTARRFCDSNNPVTEPHTVDTSADVPTIGGLRWEPAHGDANDLLYNPPDTAGYLKYTYTFPHTGSSADRIVRFYIDDVYQTTFNEGSVSGEASHSWALCLKDQHRLKVVATTCDVSNKTARNEVSFALSSQPLLSDLVLNSTGTVLTGRYSFPYTDQYSRRDLRVYVNGEKRAYDSGWSNGWQLTGPISFTNFPSGCIESIRVELDSSCSPLTAKSIGPAYERPKLDLALKNVGTSDVQATVDWDLTDYMPGYVIDLKVLKWYDQLGNEHPGYTVAGSPKQIVTVNGTWQPTFTPDGGWQQVLVQATIASCGGEVTKVAAVNRCCGAQSGNPVYFADGNMRYAETDPLPAINGQTLQRTYDSQNAMAGLFGVGWSSLFDRRIASDSITPTGGGTTHTYVYLTTNDNSMVAFEATGSTYVQRLPDDESVLGSLTFYAAGTDPGGDPGAVYEYRPQNNRLAYRYRDTDKRALGTRDIVTGRLLTIGYVAGTPATVTDSWSGVTWDLTVSGGRITTIGVSGRPDIALSYQYDATGHLTSVTAGAATYRTYAYAPLLTDIRDGDGNLIETHTYDANARAVSSTGSVDEIQSIAYSGPTTTVTMNTGQVVTYEFSAAGSAWRPAHVTGGCASCGERDTVSVYSGSHVVRQQHADGYIDESTYAGDQLVGRTMHLRRDDCDPATTNCMYASATDLENATLVATAATASTTYAYEDPLWPDRVTTTTDASVLQANDTRSDSITLDPATGEVLTRTMSGWTDAGSGNALEQHVITTALYDGTEGAAFNPGGAFSSAWLSLPQPAHMKKSIDGPRTDQADVTTFVYYPFDMTVAALWRGRLAAIKDAAGHIARYENYDEFGNAQRVVDPNGVKTEPTFDVYGRPVTSTIKGVSDCSTTADPLCATDLVTSRAYRPGGGQLSSTVDALGNITTYEYDARRRTSALSRGPATGHAQERIEYTYDEATGLKSRETYLSWVNGAWSAMRTESFSYDAKSQLSAQTHADATSMGYTYDDSGSVTSVRDENHTTANTSYSYDPARRLSSVKQTLGTGQIVTAYEYDINGNLTKVTDPNGNATIYTYDDFGRMLSQTSPVTGLTKYTYDPAGNLLTTTDANNAVTTRTYDALGRVLGSSATVGGPTESVTWSYDGTAAFGLGRLASMTDAAGSVAYTYDRRGLLLSESRTSGSVLLATSFQYDANGNRTLLRYPSGLTLTYTYDFAGRPLSLASGSTYMSNAQYLPFGPETSLSFANGTTQMRIYDARYRIQRNTLTGPLGTIADYSYTEDMVGNITAIHDMVDATYNRDFGYDDLNRLVTANSGASLWGTGSYRYDAMGNMLARDLGGTVEVDPNNPLSRHFSARADSLPAPGSIHETFSYSGTTSKLSAVTYGGTDHTMTYDAAGNEIRYFDPRTYSPRNLTSSIAEPSEDGYVHMVTYTYDGRGVRVIRSEGTSGYATPFANRYYIYSPELHLLSVSVDDNPNIWGKTAITNGTPLMKHEIAWFNGRPVAELLDGSTIRYTFTDHLGTPLLQTDPAATVTWRAEYEPYGDLWTMRTGTAADQPLRFPGQEYERRWEGAEERYNIFRWYRSGWGRYTQADPLAVGGLGLFAHGRMTRYEVPGIHKGQEHDNAVKEWGVGIYSYAADNPIVVSDPAGLKALRCRVYTLIASPGQNTLRGKCVMLGECESIFNPYDKYVTFGTIYVPSCFSCPKKCTFEAHGDGSVWMDPSTDEWDCTPWTPIYRSKEGPLDGQL